MLCNVVFAKIMTIQPYAASDSWKDRIQNNPARRRRERSLGFDAQRSQNEFKDVESDANVAVTKEVTIRDREDKSSMC